MICEKIASSFNSLIVVDVTIFAIFLMNLLENLSM